MADHERDGLTRLRAVDEALARREPDPAAIDRIGRRLQARALERPLRERLRWWPALAFAGGAAVMAGLLAPRTTTQTGDAPAIVAPQAPSTAIAHTDEVARENPATVEIARSVDPSQSAAQGPIEAPRTDSPPIDRECLAPAPRVDVGVGECVEGDGVRIDALAASALAFAGDEVAVIDGEVLFDVAPRPERPLRVVAGAAEIEVVGTRFIVHHLGRRGWISMLEGSVRARRGKGPTRLLGAGERLGWPGPGADASTPASSDTSATSADTSTPSERAEPTPTATDEGLAALLAEVAELRRRGDYDGALARLRSGERTEWSRRGRALVSYEIGAILGRPGGDPAAACAHWAEHQRRFPDAERDALLQRTLGRLGCPR